jgi:hypothetical protein
MQQIHFVVTNADELGADAAADAADAVESTARRQAAAAAGGGGAAEAGAGGGATSPTSGRQLEEATVSFKGLGMRKIALDSNAVEEKTAALGGLVEIARDLGVDVARFWVWTDKITETLLANLNEKFPALRNIAAVGLVSVFMASLANTADRTHGARTLAAILPPLAERIAAEQNDETL